MLVRLDLVTQAIHSKLSLIQAVQTFGSIQLDVQIMDAKTINNMMELKALLFNTLDMT